MQSGGKTAEYFHLVQSSSMPSSGASYKTITATCDEADIVICSIDIGGYYQTWLSTLTVDGVSVGFVNGTSVRFGYQYGLNITKGSVIKTYSSGSYDSGYMQLWSTKKPD